MKKIIAFLMVVSWLAASVGTFVFSYGTRYSYTKGTRSMVGLDYLLELDGGEAMLVPNGMVYKVYENKKTVTVQEMGRCKDTDVIIAGTYDGLTVTAIGEKAFSDRSSLKSVSLPEGLTTIGKSAFFNCKSLTTINLPSTLTELGDYAFEFCGELTEINIPQGITSIGESTFYLCDNMTKVTIPRTVTEIGKSAFYMCVSLTDINYTGTMAEWNMLYKDTAWDEGISTYTVHCTDGDIIK